MVDTTWNDAILDEQGYLYTFLVHTAWSSPVVREARRQIYPPSLRTYRRNVIIRRDVREMYEKGLHDLDAVCLSIQSTLISCIHYFCL